MYLPIKNTGDFDQKDHSFFNISWIAELMQLQSHRYFIEQGLILHYTPIICLLYGSFEINFTIK